MQALYEQLPVRVQTPGRLLRFDGNVTAVDATEDASLWRGVAAKEVLTWCGEFPIVAIWTLEAQANAENVFKEKYDPQAKAVYAGERISSNHRSSVVVCWQELLQSLLRQTQAREIGVDLRRMQASELATEVVYFVYWIGLARAGQTQH